MIQRETLGGRLRLGDIITKLDGKSVETVDDCYRFLEHHTIGDQIVIEKKSGITVERV